jgi:hypothetical protein
MVTWLPEQVLYGVPTLRREVVTKAIPEDKPAASCGLIEQLGPGEGRAEAVPQKCSGPSLATREYRPSFEAGTTPWGISIQFPGSTV